MIHPELNPLKIGLTASKNVDSPCKTESFVFTTLSKVGHDVEFIELSDNLDPLVQRVNQGPVDIVVNLLEELSGEAKFDFHAISYLESKGVRFTGNGPRSLMITRDKYLSKLIVSNIGILTPQSYLVRELSDLKKIDIAYPIFLKMNSEDASLGLTQANRTQNKKELVKSFKKLRGLSRHKMLAEEFIQGTDISVGIIGNQSLIVLPARELKTPKGDWVAGEDVKFKSKLRLENKIRSVQLKWRSKREKIELEKSAINIYRSLGMRGYGRIDFRKSGEQYYFLEANANPDLSKDEDFSMAAKSKGISYEDLLERILRLGLAKK